MEKQFAAIHENPDVIFATPGRFVHLCLEMGLKLTSVEYVVFDEVDRLFEMGLGEQLREILARLPDTRYRYLYLIAVVLASIRSLVLSELIQTRPNFCILLLFELF